MSIERLITPEEITIDMDRAAMGEHNDCAVKALTLTTGLPYREVHAALKAAGRRDRCGTYIHQTERAVKALGFEIRRVKFNPCTTRTVTKQLPKSGRFYVRVSRHALAVVDGKVCDWTHGRLKRIKEILEVVRAGAVTPPAVVVAPIVKKPYVAKVHIDFVELRETLRVAHTVSQLAILFGVGDSNQIRSAIDRARRYGANIVNVGRNTFQLI